MTEFRSELKKLAERLPVSASRMAEITKIALQSNQQQVIKDLEEYIRNSPTKLVGVYVIDSICRAQPYFKSEFERILPPLFPCFKQVDQNDLVIHL